MRRSGTAAARGRGRPLISRLSFFFFNPLRKVLGKNGKRRDSSFQADNYAGKRDFTRLLEDKKKFFSPSLRKIRLVCSRSFLSYAISLSFTSDFFPSSILPHNSLYEGATKEGRLSTNETECRRSNSPGETVFH